MTDEKDKSFDELSKTVSVNWIKFQIKKSKQEIKNCEQGICFLEKMLKEKEKQND